MISYVECLGGEGAGPAVGSRCWNGVPDEELDELLPRQIAALQPKTEGSLRRRLLSAKIHQQHGAILGQNAAEAHGNRYPIQEPRPGYTLPAASPFGAQTHFVEPEVVPPQYRYRPSRGRQNFFFCFGRRRGRSYGPEAAQTTPLLHTAEDGDSKWSVHYNTQKPQQRLLFFSGKKRSGSSDDLRGQRSTENSVSACNGLTQHGYSPPNTAPHPPFSFGLDQSEGSTARRGWKDRSRRMSSAFSDDEERFILNNRRPLTPPMLNPAHRSSCWDVFASAYELTEATEATEATETETTTRLPTPEEKMRKQAEAVAADIVPINITDSPTGSPGSPGSPGSAVLPAGFSGVGRPAEENLTHPAPAAERGGAREEGKSSLRRIRAPRGGGMCSLMASLTSAPPTDPSPLPQPPPLPRPETNSSLDSCGTLSASSSCCQPRRLGARYSGSLRLPSASVLPVSISSSSIADSQLSFQTLQSCNSGDTWNYEPLSPSASGDHDGDWSCIATETRRVSGEGVNSSGLSTPSRADTSSLCSEFSAFSNSSLRKHSTSSSSSSTMSDSRGIGAARSISLRKSTRPPPPPKRSVSLTQRPARSKRSAQTYHDPWVPRRNSQSDFTCNAGAFFEPLRPDYHTESSALSSERQAPNGGHSNVSERETSVSSVAASQRLASPFVQSHQTPNVSKDQQLRLNLNLEPLRPDYHTEASALASERQAPNGGHSNVSERETCVSFAAASQRLMSPSVQRHQSDFNSNAVLSSEHLPLIAGCSKVSKDQQLRLNLNAKTSVVSSSAAVSQRLPSPSSGYSSQSNTPTPGTPVSSPSSPLST
ncbi:hypothetical protein PFLUV_G00000070 [Perca fluviatilis]|uniref:Uncharacterized protein n=1 Tax=Perca fluviatilis TaxID=8168 RepID=A0A6A5FL80_PERFL|nr:hypothetical protein PFLUV_G00000070 [Perca fluviatilis]